MAFFAKHLRKILFISSTGLATAGLATALTVSFLDPDESKKIKKWNYDWDKLNYYSSKKGSEPNSGSNEYSTASRHILLIRHGQYNTSGKEDADRILTPLGREQCEKLGQRLKELDYPYDKIVVSKLTRAVESASIVSKYLPDVPVDSCPLINEGAPIQPEPPNGRWKPDLRKFYLDSARIEAAFRKHFYRADPSQKKDSYEVYVCHANVIRYFVLRALQLSPEAWLRFSLNHCSVTRLCIRPSGRVVCYGIGDSGFLPPNMLTSSNTVHPRVVITPSISASPASAPRMEAARG